MEMNDTTYLNIIWILSSFLLLNYGITTGRIYISFLYIIMMFCLIWFAGIKEKQKELEKSLMVTGEKAKSQWG